MKGRKRTRGTKSGDGPATMHMGSQGAGVSHGQPMAAQTMAGMAKGGGKGRRGGKMRRGAY